MVGSSCEPDAGVAWISELSGFSLKEQVRKIDKESLNVSERNPRKKMHDG